MPRAHGREGYFTQMLKDKCCGWNGEGGEVMCRVRLGPEGLPNQERELDLILSAREAVAGFLK